MEILAKIGTPSISSRPTWIWSTELQLFGLWNFVVAQPIYSLFSDNPEFFVAHQATPSQLVTLTLAMSFAIPLSLVLPGRCTRLIGRNVDRALYRLVLAVMVLLGILPMLNRSEHLPPVVGLVLAVALALACAILYDRVGAMRSALNFTAIGAVLFPAHFLFFTPIVKLVFPQRADEIRVTAKADAPPVVLVVFDSFATIALLDESKQIDAIRYPNIAAFARQATWFPYATSASKGTAYSVPAILTGELPETTKQAPILQNYPQNLFTLLRSSYDMNVHETFTSLCPAELRTKRATTGSLSQIGSDIAIVYAHIVTPPPWREYFPSITHDWKGFGKVDSATDGEREKFTGVDARRRQTLQFIEDVRKTERPMLHFLHVILPHLHYNFLPTGQFYAPLNVLDGFRSTNYPLASRPYMLLAQQRYLLQVGLVDTLLGKLIQRLKQVGVYDDALIIVTADHGTAFREGEPMRRLSKRNWPDTLMVPFIAKLPDQSMGAVSDRVVNGTDVLPTIADLAGIEVPWEVDGTSVFAEEFPKRNVVRIMDPETMTRLEVDTLVSRTFPGLGLQLRRFGYGTPLGELTILDKYPELLGRRLDTLDISPGEGLLFELEQESEFKRAIDLSQKYVPLYVSGSVFRSNDRCHDEAVAIAVNGVVTNISSAPCVSLTKQEFRAVLPMSSLRNGRNEIEVLLVQDRFSGGVRLISGPNAKASHLSVGKSGLEEITGVDGSRYRISSQGSLGFVEPLRVEHSLVLVSGWAVRRKGNLTATEVQIYADGELCRRFSATRKRSDIAKSLGSEFLHSGYRGHIPASSLRGAVLQAYALFEDATASPLQFYYVPSSDLDKRVDFERFFFFSGATLSEGHQSCGGPHPCIIVPGREALKISRDAGDGRLESLRLSGDHVRFTGWAVDERRRSPARAVLVFDQGSLIYTGYPRVGRADVSNSKHLVHNVGRFDFYMRADLSPSILSGVEGVELNRRIRVFGIFDKGAIWELVAEGGQA